MMRRSISRSFGVRTRPRVAAAVFAFAIGVRHHRLPTHLPEGDGLGGSRPESIIVGRIGPIPSGFVLRDLEERAGLSCSIGVSLFTDLGVSGTIGLGAGALSTSGDRVFVECEADPSFNPSAARAPAARISSSVSLAGVDFFSRGFDFRGVGVVDSGATCSEGCGVGLGGSGFFSLATITSCACTFPMKMILQSRVRRNPFSIMSPAKRMNPFTSPRLCDVAEFNPVAAQPESPATGSAAAIRLPDKSRRDAFRTAETAHHQNNGHWSHALPSLSAQIRPPPARPRVVRRHRRCEIFGGTYQSRYTNASKCKAENN
jgi:hypothetical protein